MKYIYFKFKDEENWIELDDEGYACRQIIINSNNDVSLSCFDDCLAEKIIEINENIKIINAIDFEQKWRSHIEKYRSKWNQVKSCFPIGKSIEGRIKYFYPQGIIFKADEFIGVADYDECKANSLRTNLGVHHKITGIISSYDDINMWVRITNSKAL